MTNLVTKDAAKKSVRNNKKEEDDNKSLSSGSKKRGTEEDIFQTPKPKCSRLDFSRQKSNRRFRTVTTTEASCNSLRIMCSFKKDELLKCAKEEAMDWRKSGTSLSNITDNASQ